MPYEFTTPVGEGHFLHEWIRYAGECTDASHEYHEAVGLCLLATATPGVRARLSAWPRGLGTNLFVLLLGGTTESRKSTSLALGADALEAALPDAAMPSRMTPEAFVEQLARRSGKAAAWFMDEFAALVRDVHHKAYMATLRELLLTAYDGRNYEYRRHSKRVKGGGRAEDVDRVVDPHLVLVGAATPAIFQSLTAEDLDLGLLPRFAVVMPTTKPDRLPFYGMRADTTAERNRLVAWLHAIAAWAERGPKVHFEDAALRILDEYAAELEAWAAQHPEDRGATMHQRLPVMAVKVAMLLAVGDIEPSKAGDLTITDFDAQAALTIVRRWQAYADAFAERIEESAFEQKVQTVLRLVQRRRLVPLRVVATNTKVPKRILDEILETLVTRGQITVVEQDGKVFLAAAEAAEGVA